MLHPFTGEHVDPDVHAVIHDTALLLTRLGHHVHEAAPPIDMGALSDANVTNVAICTTRNLAEHAALVGHEATPESIESITAMWRHIGQSRTAEDLQIALETFQHAAIAMDSFFQDYDILLSPTLAKPPIDLGILSLATDDPGTFGREFQDFCPFASLANITGTPAMTLPLGMTHDRLPIGIMAQGPFASETLLLQLASRTGSRNPLGPPPAPDLRLEDP
jgi:amidase